MTTLVLRAKRWLYLLHRWMGVGLCLLFVLWFASGVVMMYVGYPKLTPAERLAHLPWLDAAQVRLGPAQALRAAGLEQAAEIRLAASRAGQPFYAIVPLAGGRTLRVDAASGQLAGRATPAQARASALAYFGARHAAREGGLVDEDAHTHTRTLDAHRPLYVFEMDDPARTRLYVSSSTGEVVRDAPRLERGWNYVGAWLHWLYPLRGAYWHDIVVWLSVLGVALTVSGTVVGLWRWRFARPYASGSRSPYRERFMRWHHIAGLLFAATTLTWIFSGLMSMNPWQVFGTRATQLDRAAYRGGPLQAGNLPAGPAVAMPARELVWTRVAGQTLLQHRGHRFLSAGATPHVFRNPYDEPASILWIIAHEP
ncbi:PepSY domain-containing protein, partial [Bordetella bronchiseptica]